MPLVDVPQFPDDRWPDPGARPNEHGVESSLSYNLTTSADGEEQGPACLNIYGSEPAALTWNPMRVASFWPHIRPLRPAQ